MYPRDTCQKCVQKLTIVLQILMCPWRWVNFFTAYLVNGKMDKEIIVAHKFGFGPNFHFYIKPHQSLLSTGELHN